MEYTEQGMPVGIIQQILGHCSLQMTLHYAKVSEDMLFQKWKETEKLGSIPNTPEEWLDGFNTFDNTVVSSPMRTIRLIDGRFGFAVDRPYQ